jgi:hypothetical protein
MVVKAVSVDRHKSFAKKSRNAGREVRPIRDTQVLSDGRNSKSKPLEKVIVRLWVDRHYACDTELRGRIVSELPFETLPGKVSR